MVKIHSGGTGGTIDLALWRQFQQGLSDLLRIPLSLFNSERRLLSTTSRIKGMCETLPGVKRDADCELLYDDMLKSAFSSDDAYVCKCHHGLHVFAVPISLDALAAKVTVAVVGGGVRLEHGYERLESNLLITPGEGGGEGGGPGGGGFGSAKSAGPAGPGDSDGNNGLLNGLTPLETLVGAADHASYGNDVSGDDYVDSKGPRDYAATLPPKNIFTLIETVRAMAAPFLSGIYSSDQSTLPGLEPLRSNVDPGRVPGKVPGSRGAMSTNPDAILKALEGMQGSSGSASDLGTLCNAILSNSTELVGAAKGSVMVLNKKDNSLVVRAAKGPHSEKLSNFKVAVGHGIAGSIAQTGTPVLVANIEESFPERKKRHRYSTPSFASLPLRLGDRTVGVLNVSDKISGEVFSAEDLRTLKLVTGYASLAIERNAYRNMSKELRLLSITDQLTGVLNRRYFQERLIEEAERAQRYGAYFTLFIIDVDDFKLYNDMHGHNAGDAMLKHISGVMRGAVRSVDVLARYGGEEFAVILPYTRKEEARTLAERMRKAVEGSAAAGPGLATPLKKPLTISIGVAEFPSDAAITEELIHAADKSMYYAKSLGKNRVVLYEK